MINKAVILVGGHGTRMLPYTKACAKEMMPLCGKPALHYVAAEAVEAGISEILFVISPDKQEIVKYFSYDDALEKELKSIGKEYLLNDLNDILNRAEIKFVTQYEADGTGGALLLAEEFVSGKPLLCMNGDDIMTGGVSKQLAECYNKDGGAVIGVAEVDSETIRNCGSVKVVGRDGRLLKIDGIIEKPKQGMEYSRFATQGRYVLNPSIFGYLRAAEKNNGEIRLTDALNMQAATEGLNAYIYQGMRYDMGSNRGYLKGVVDFAMKDKDQRQIMNEIINEYRGKK